MIGPRMMLSCHQFVNAGFQTRCRLDIDLQRTLQTLFSFTVQRRQMHARRHNLVELCVTMKLVLNCLPMALKSFNVIGRLQTLLLSGCAQTVCNLPNEQVGFDTSAATLSNC